jgi:hypothetical protein
MAIRILEAATIHEAVIMFWPRVGLAAGGDGLLDDRIDALATVEREAEKEVLPDNHNE